MTRKKEETPHLEENTETLIDILKSSEFDLAKKKARKRRMMDDYDYNDPFMEPLEGEYDPVELECKLDNFYVYRGDLSEDPKKVAQKYKRKKKRTKKHVEKPNLSQLTDASQGNKGDLKLSFEKYFDYASFKCSWSKLDIAFSNLILSLMSFRDVDSPAAVAAARSILERAAPTISVSHLPEKTTKASSFEIAEYYDEILKAKIESLYEKLSKVIKNTENYTDNGRLFSKLSDNNLLDDILDFHILYIKFYSSPGEVNLNSTRKRATWIITSTFLSECTNRKKLKAKLLTYASKLLKEYGLTPEEVNNLTTHPKDDKLLKETAPSEGTKSIEAISNGASNYPSIGASTAAGFSLEANEEPSGGIKEKDTYEDLASTVDKKA